MNPNQTHKGTRAVSAAVRLSLLASAFVATGFSYTAMAAAPATSDTDLEEVTVTGSILHRTDTEAPSPVSVITAEDVEKRGDTTIQEALQSLAANNGPALTNSFTSNGAFAGGASAVSLRGLTTSSTLVLFDGLRAAYYPLADDGTRNFVDLNTIPDDIVERVEVLRDGASSSYGADAVAGVVNIITKKQFTGLSFRAEGGISERGDAANSRFSVIAGTGDLNSDGYNFYMSAFFLDSDAVRNSDRGYPYNTDDQSGLCFEGTCGPNNIINAPDAETGALSALGIASNFLVRPYDATNTTAQGRYRMLNPALGCGPNMTPYTLSAAELAAVPTAPPVVCQEDFANKYQFIMPNAQRYGLSARATVRLNDNAEAYTLVNYQESTTNYSYIPATIRANAPAGIIYPRYSTSATSGFYGNSVLTLPVWVCAARVNCATATDAHLNPNNPFAASNQVARLLGRLQDENETDATRSRVFRIAGGVTGDLDAWHYDVGATVMHNDLRHTQDGYVYIQHLLDVIADGTYNFVDPSLNTQTVRDYVTPTNVNNSSSDLAQLQVIASRSLMDLQGGPLQLGLGTSVHYEAVDAPSANADYNGPTQRYFRLNAFGTRGSRTVASAFAEVNAPLMKMLEADLSGRYDHYSSGQDAFSPKLGLKFTPFEMLAIRGTYSQGFRIPSFAESNALPTTGFVNATAANFPDSYLATYGCSQATFSTCPIYLRNYSYGQTSTGTPGLKPEKSESYTFGVIIEPLPQLSVTVDYYNIKKDNAIATANYSPAISAYYSGQPIPAGYGVTPDAADVNNPTLQPRLAFVAAGFINANEILSEGIDFGANFSHQFGEVTWTSALETSYILELSTTFPDGTKESYAGTLGNFNLTAGSGTPRWHGSWINTVAYEKFSASLTADYFGGYNLSAEDQEGPDTSGDCGLSGGFTPCNVKDYLTFDLVGSWDVTDKLQVYANITNLLDKMPPVDPVTYGAINYNAVQGGTGIIGRAYRLGVKMNF